MLALRITERAKAGCTSKLAELFKLQPEYVPSPPHGWRVYSPTQMSPWGVVIIEFEFESMAECESWWKEALAAPRFREWYEQRVNLIEPGGGGELWSVEQFG